MSEPCRKRQGEGYGACDDALLHPAPPGAQQRRRPVRALPRAAGYLPAGESAPEANHPVPGCGRAGAGGRGEVPGGVRPEGLHRIHQDACPG